MYFLKPEEVSKAIGRGGVNIRLASELTGYEIDVQREGLEEEDVELTEFTDEIEDWVIQEFKNIGLDTARSVLETSVLKNCKKNRFRRRNNFRCSKNFKRRIRRIIDRFSKSKIYFTNTR